MKTLYLILLLLSFNNKAETPVNAGLAGTWHNNLIPGQGLFIDVIPDSEVLFAGWFTYLPDGTEDQQNLYWLTLQGVYSGSLAELTIYRTINGQFNETTDEENVVVGIGSLLFSSCTSAQFNYQLDEYNLSGTIELNRVTPDVFCSDHIDNITHQEKSFNYPPKVSQVVVNEDEGLIEIKFDLTDAENDLLELTFLRLDHNNKLMKSHKPI